MTQVEIRLIVEDDYLQLYRLIEKNRQRLLAYFSKTSNAINDLEAARRFTNQKVRRALKKQQFYFVVLLTANLEMIGGIIVKNIDWKVPKAELAYFVDEEHEGKGIASSAVNWIKEYAFNSLKMQKLYVKFDPVNIGSKRVAIKNGFQKEGYLRSEFRNGYGDLIDLERYGLVK